LELFTSGYPAGFLKALIAELPELRSLVAYSQVFTGISKETSDDAVAFIKGAKKLRALHLLDAIISPDFVRGIAPIVKELEKPLMFIEINYTNHSNDPASLKRIPAAELPLLVHQGLISCSFNMSPPEVRQGKTEMNISPVDGIQVLNSEFSQTLVERLLQVDSAPKVMKHLNITLYPVSVEQLKKIITKHKGLMVMNVSVEVKDGNVQKQHLFEALVAGTNLEQIEIVLCPPSASEELDLTVEVQGLEALSKACKKLSSFKVNQMRCQKTQPSAECTLIGGKWHIKMSKVQTENLPHRRKGSKQKKVQSRCLYRLCS
jgi:hypothetical protein